MSSVNPSQFFTRHLRPELLHRLVHVCLFFACVFLLVGFLHWRQTGALTPQSITNLIAAAKPTLMRAVAEYPTGWPPVYPASLWVFSAVGLPIRLFNLLCFYGVLGTVWVFVRSYYPRLAPSVPVLFVALVHANYPNLHQQTAEALFLLVAVMSLLLLGWSKDHPSSLLAGGLGTLTAAAALTRFFALFWIVPIAFVHLTALSAARSWRKRTVHALAYITPIGLFVLPWLLYLHRRTGSFSGLDRSAPRELPPEIAYWSNLTGLGTNVKFVLKTTFIDLFSPNRTADHRVVSASSITTSETIVLFAVLGLAALAIVWLFQVFRKLPRSSHIALATNLLIAPQSLPVHFAGIYVVAIIAAWTASNNDPIYTRFMFPSYTFLVLTVCGVYAWLQDRVTSVWGLLPFYVLGSLFVGTNLLNIKSGLTISWSIFQ